MRSAAAEQRVDHRAIAADLKGDAAAINTNYATQAGLDPVKDAILREDPKGPYTNLIAVRAADKDKSWVKTLVSSYQTPEVRDFILTKFKGAILPAW
jgi:D-methionine transport system substrate-binding protein